MGTRIERLEESLRKAKEKQDISKLNNVYNRIIAALVVLRSHTFRKHRAEKINYLTGILDDVRVAIVDAQSIATDSPAEEVK